MNVLVVSDAHIWKSEDGRYWCNTAMHGYKFWTRYLDAFEHVTVVARVANISSSEAVRDKFIRADGDNVSVIDLPFIRGVKGYLLHFLKMRHATRLAAQNGDCAIFRLPSIPAYLMLTSYKKKDKPYAIEVVIDPEDEYGDIPLMRMISKRMLQNSCANANGVSYVTKHYLQSKYPSGKAMGKTDKQYFESYYSSIDLSKDFFYSSRLYSSHENDIKIIHIANSINNYNKGHKTLLDITKRLKDNGVKARVTFVGSGDLIDKFRQYAKEIGIDDQVFFTGYISGKDGIRDLLIQNELFVFPTRAEGLPRALIEAMATGLPCLSSNVDGIPELLSKEFLFDYNDVTGFTNKILEIIKDFNILENMGISNYKKAQLYESSILRTRRREFYKQLRNTVEIGL